MWAENWQNLYHDVKPFKNATLVDVTEQLKLQNFTARKMFDTANEFYTSLGLLSNAVGYQPPAIIERPNSRVIECHASAMDFCDGKDFRIKMCTKVNMQDFAVIHHELGHIQYFLQYKDLPMKLRSGANPGFHAAIGDTIALSATNPQHLVKVRGIVSFSF